MVFHSSRTMRVLIATACVAAAAAAVVLRGGMLLGEARSASTADARRTAGMAEALLASIPPDALEGKDVSAFMAGLLAAGDVPAEALLHPLAPGKDLRWGSLPDPAPDPSPLVDSLLRRKASGPAVIDDDALVTVATPVDVGGRLPSTQPLPALLVLRRQHTPALAAARERLLVESALLAALLFPFLVRLLRRPASREETTIDDERTESAEEETLTLRRPQDAELERVRASLREAERKLEEQSRTGSGRGPGESTVLDALPEGVFLADAGGNLTGLNASAARLLSVDRSEGLPPDLATLFKSDRIARALASSDIIAAPGYALVRHTVSTPDGRDLGLEVASRRLPGGGLVGILRPAGPPGTATAPVEAAARLVLDSPSVGVIACDGTTMTFANGAAEELTGRQGRELLGRPLWDIAHQDDRHAVEDSVRTLLDAGASTNRTLVRIATPSGETRWVDLAVTAATVDGSAVLAATLTDRSAERSLHAASEESAHRYNALLAATQNAVLVVERGVIVAANPAAAALLRAAAADDLLNTPANRILHPEDRATLVGLMREVLQSGSGTPASPARLVTLTGSTLETEVALQPTTRDGRPALQLSIRDRSGARATERRLRSEHAAAEAALEHLPFACWIADRDGRIQYQNPRAVELHGHRVGETFIAPDPPPPGGERMYEAVLHALRGETLTVPPGSEGAPEGMLVRPITVDGVVTSALGVEPGPAGGAGTVDQSIGTILQHLPVRLVALDDRGIVVFSAGAFPTRTDGGGTEGPQPAEFGAGGAHPRVRELVRTALRGDGSRDVLEMNGSLFDTRYEPLRDGMGGVRGAIGVAVDITGRIRSEQALARLNAELEERVTDRTAQLEASNRELEAFTYSVSHDLRTPLRAIEGFTRILIEDHAAGMTAEGRDILKTLSRSARRMAMMIEDVLTLSRMSRKELDRTPIDMNALFRSAADELAPDLEAVPALKLTIDPLPAANGDLGMIRQVAVNLLSNAVKFSRTRRTPHIEIGSFAGEGGATVYFVQDNGVGFDMKHADRLFQVFQRLHSSDQFEGTGVGLAIVQRILARHGGTVWARGEAGRGATFYFTW